MAQAVIAHLLRGLGDIYSLDRSSCAARSMRNWRRCWMMVWPVCVDAAQYNGCTRWPAQFLQRGRAGEVFSEEKITVQPYLGQPLLAGAEHFLLRRLHEKDSASSRALHWYQSGWAARRARGCRSVAMSCDCAVRWRWVARRPAHRGIAPWRSARAVTRVPGPRDAGPGTGRNTPP